MKMLTLLGVQEEYWASTNKYAQSIVNSVNKCNI